MYTFHILAPFGMKNPAGSQDLLIWPAKMRGMKVTRTGIVMLADWLHKPESTKLGESMQDW
jgi:hypothetical protein